MKKYKLKQWYPDTPSYMMEGFIVDYYDEEEKAIYTYPDGMRLGFKLPSHHLECRNFWELIEEKEPLFTTEDGVKIFVGDSFIIVEDDFTKHKLTAHNLPYTEDFKRFKHESNADEYIWRNKRLFSYNDLRSWDINGGTQEEALKVAKERVEE